MWSVTGTLRFPVNMTKARFPVIPDRKGFHCGEQIRCGGDEVCIGKISTVEGANLGFAVFDDAPSGIMLPRAGSVECFFHYFGWLVGFCSVEGKIGGGDYRKRHSPVECAGVERQGKGRDMERKRECGAIREQREAGSD